MKILVYGFKPYKHWKENITEKILRKIKPRKNLKKVIFPVEFERKVFLDRIKRYKPDIILGLGQCSRGKKIRIERKAVNLKKHNKKEKAKIISRNKPKYLFTSLKLKKDKGSRISYNAGQYVCNFSIYVISDFSKNKIGFAFLHIPSDYNLNKAVRFVESKINRLASKTHKIL